MILLRGNGGELSKHVVHKCCPVNSKSLARSSRQLEGNVKDRLKQRILGRLALKGGLSVFLKLQGWLNAVFKRLTAEAALFHALLTLAS